jgi:hypothetical protein
MWGRERDESMKGRRKKRRKDGKQEGRKNEKEGRGALSHTNQTELLRLN